MATLVSPGVSVTITDESQYSSSNTRDTVPLVVIATHQDKANPSGTGTAGFTTKAEAGDPKLITSPRELIQEFGNPVFYDINGTVQQGFELNEYGLLTAYKALNVTNRVWVVRGDVDLAELASSAVAPTGDVLNGTYWFDTNDTEYGIFVYNSGVWTRSIPTIIDDETDLTGSAPSASFGKNGDIAVVVVNNSSTVGYNQAWEKISGSWYLLGSTAWDAVTQTTAIGTIGFTSSTSTSLSGLPYGGDTVSVTVGAGAPSVTTLNPIITGTASVVDSGNLLGLKTFIANSETITLGSATAGTIAGTVTHASASVATAASCGDILRISDWSGSAIVSDDATLRIRMTGADQFPVAAASESFEINNQPISTGSGLANAAAAAVAINAVIGAGGTAPQGITASGALIAAEDETDLTVFAVGSGYASPEIVTMSDGSVITIDTDTAGAVATFTVTAVGSTGFLSLAALTQVSTNKVGTGFTVTPVAANVVIQLIKDKAASGEALADTIEVDLTGLATAFETTPTTFPAAGASASTLLSVTEVVQSINEYTDINTDNITASVGGSNVLSIADSVSAIQLENVAGTPVADFGMASATSIAIATVVTQLDGLTNTSASGSSGNPVVLTYTGSATFNITGGTSLTTLGFSIGNHGVSLAQVVSQINADTGSDPLAAVLIDGSLSFVQVTDVTGNDTLTISGTGATKLGLPATVGKNQLFYSPHYTIPSGSTEGDFWLKTTSPNFGADYVVRVWEEASGQWTNQTALLYTDNADAFDNVTLVDGAIYVHYDFLEDGTASHVIKRYNGATSLSLPVLTADFTAGVTIKIGNGRATTASVDATSITNLVTAINNLGQANLSAVETTTGFTISNDIGEDIVLEDNASTVSAVLGSPYTAGRYSNWAQLRNYSSGDVSSYTASADSPTAAPTEDAKWYDGGVSTSDFDILLHNGTTWVTHTGDIQVSATKPSTQSDGSTPFAEGDLWINSTDMENFPIINKWDDTNNIFVLVDNTDQTTQDGILFADARPDASSNLDPDAPNPLVYPSGMLLWNTRASSLVVKEYKSGWFLGGDTGLDSYDSTDYTANSYDVGNDTYSALSSEARWVTVSGNQLDGSPYMGRHAQRIVVIQAMAAALQSEELRDPRRKFFNLLLTPGYPELMDEMVTLNVDRRETGFIIGDTPMRLSPTSNDIQDWATNANGAASNGDDGLVTRDEYSAIYYPSTGLTTNLDGAEVAMPSSLGALYAYLYNDNVAYPWFAPAGLNRGILSGVFASVGYINSEDEYTTADLSRGMQDTLYTNNINPIIFTPGRGLYVNGQKTLSPAVSALDRVNVARLIVYLRYQAELLAEEFLFEINDQITRDQVKSTFDRFLGDLLGLRALYDYLVVVDDSNNTPQRIDAYELWIDIAIQPAKAIEFIYIPIRIKNTGEDLTA